jgi:hypothetical protein
LSGFQFGISGNSGRGYLQRPGLLPKVDLAFYNNIEYSNRIRLHVAHRT